MRRAWWLLAAAAADILAGAALITITWSLPFWHALYCSIGVASTVGCDVTPPGQPGWAAAVAIELTAIPLLAACFGQLHLDKVRAHVDTRFDEHHRVIGSRLDAIEKHEPR